MMQSLRLKTLGDFARRPDRNHQSGKCITDSASINQDDFRVWWLDDAFSWRSAVDKRLRFSWWYRLRPPGDEIPPIMSWLALMIATSPAGLAAVSIDGPKMGQQDDI